jgi:hypothetical protein
MMEYLVDQLGNEKPFVQTSAAQSFELLLAAARAKDCLANIRVNLEQSLSALLALAKHPAADVRLLGVVALKQVSRGSAAGGAQHCAAQLTRPIRSQVAKASPETCRSQLVPVVTCLVSAVKDTNIRVKMAGERALLHALEMRTRVATLDEFASAADPATSRFVRDYARRVLARLSADSDEERESTNLPAAEQR